VSGKTCAICIRPPYRTSPFCVRCRNIILPKKDHPSVIAGLKRSYDPVPDGFRCMYSGELLNTDDMYDPWYLVLDHLFPGQREVAPSAAWINGAKGGMTYPFFLTALGEFAHYLRTGEPFDTGVLTREEWKRNLMYMRLMGRKVA
jgi:hypothetical protein